MQERKVAYTGDLTGTIQRIRSEQACNVVLLPETFLSAGIGIALPKGAVYKKYFDQV